MIDVIVSRSSIGQIPTPLTPKRQQSLAIKWIIQMARERKGKPMEECLFLEIMDAYNNEVSPGANEQSDSLTWPFTLIQQ